LRSLTAIANCDPGSPLIEIMTNRADPGRAFPAGASDFFSGWRAAAQPLDCGSLLPLSPRSLLRAEEA